jgi:hypothetical protein
VQASGDQYLDPCQWDNKPLTVTVVSGQNATGVTLKLTAASVLNIQIIDSQKVMSQTTKDGRRPELSLGVWGPKGLYYPARRTGSGGAVSIAGAGNSYGYRLAVPRDTALKFHIASHDLKLGDATGVALPANASPQAFQHASGDPAPKSFSFSVLGLLP